MLRIFFLLLSFFPLKTFAEKIPTFAIPNNIGENGLNPFNAKSAQQKFLVQLIFETLVTQNSHNQFVPLLAKKWRIAEDGSHVEFELNNEVIFSNKTKLSVVDVIKSIERNCNDTTIKRAGEITSKSTCSGLLNKITQVGDNKIRIFSQLSHTLLLSRLASADFVIFKKTKDSYIGTGPYLIESQTNKAAVFRENTSHIRRPFIKRFKIRTIDEKDINESLRKKQIQGAIMYLSTSINTQNNEYQYIKSQTPTTSAVVFLNNSHEYFNETKLRARINNSIRNKEIYKCYKDSYKPNGIVPFGIGGSLPQVSKKRVTKKIAHMTSQKARSIIFYAHSGRYNKCAHDKILASFRENGFKLRIVYKDNYEDLFPLYLAKQTHGFIELAAFKHKDAYSILKYFISSSKRNFIHLHSYDYDRIISEANSAKSRSQRLLGYQKAVDLLQRESRLIPISYFHHSIVLSKTCFNPTIEINDFNPFHFIKELKISQEVC